MYKKIQVSFLKRNKRVNHTLNVCSLGFSLVGNLTIRREMAFSTYYISDTLFLPVNFRANFYLSCSPPHLFRLCLYTSKFLVIACPVNIFVTTSLKEKDMALQIEECANLRICPHYLDLHYYVKTI